VISAALGGHACRGSHLGSGDYGFDHRVNDDGFFGDFFFNEGIDLGGHREDG
jgi:hypothetical protein